jgi:CAAX protease family protein
MNPHTLFINQHGRLRSGWRLGVFVASFLVLYFLLGGGLRIVYEILYATEIRIPYAGSIADLIYRALLLVSALGAGYLCCRILEGLPWRSLGLTLHSGWFRDFVFGSIVGLLSLSFAVAIAVAAGGLQFTMNANDVLWSTTKSIATSAVLFVGAALVEEAMFRGYALQTLTRAQLAWLGVFLTSVPFATVHLWNPNVVPGVTFANTALAGIWLAIGYLRTRSLWLPLGVHWSWNWTMGSLFGLPVSGMTLVSHPLVQGKDLGPAWITGGSYGIEGGAACTVALLLSSLFLWRTRWVAATPEQLKLTSEENPVIPKVVEAVLSTKDLPMSDEV